MESIIRVSLGAAMCQPCQGASQPKFGVWFGRPWIGQAWAKNETARGHMSQCKGNHDCYPNDALAHGQRPNFVRAAPGTHPNALLVTFFMFAIHGPFSILDSFSLFLMPSYSLQKHKTYMAKQAFLFFCMSRSFHSWYMLLFIFYTLFSLGQKNSSSHKLVPEFPVPLW